MLCVRTCFHLIFYQLQLKCSLCVLWWLPLNNFIWLVTKKKKDFFSIARPLITVCYQKFFRLDRACKNTLKKIVNQHYFLFAYLYVFLLFLFIFYFFFVFCNLIYVCWKMVWKWNLNNRVDGIDWNKVFLDFVF